MIFSIQFRIRGATQYTLDLDIRKRNQVILLSVRRDDGGDLLGRAPQDHAHARRQGDPDAGRRARYGHGQEGRGARQEARLVPRPPVRESGQPRLSPQYHRARDPERLCRTAARLLRHGLGHGRNADRRRRDDESRAPRREVIVSRACGGRAAGGQAFFAAQDPGLDARLHTRGAERQVADRIVTVTRCRGDRELRGRSPGAKASSAESPRGARSLRL